jgi:hypothetical protein
MARHCLLIISWRLSILLPPQHAAHANARKVLSNERISTYLRQRYPVSLKRLCEQTGLDIEGTSKAPASKNAAPHD